MNELRPLLDSCEDELECALLRSAHLDAPNPVGLRDTALALGLAASTAQALALSVPAAHSLVVGVSTIALPPAAPLAAAGGAAATTSAVTTSAVTSAATTSVVTTSAVTSAATTSAVTSALGTASLTVLGKGVLGGTLVSIMALTTLDQTLGMSSPAPPPISAARSSGAGTAPANQPVPRPARAAAALAPTSDAEPSAEPEPALSGRRVSTKVRAVAAASVDPPVRAEPPPRAAFEPIAHPPASAAPTSASLAAEIRILDQARAALAAGDTARAGSLLDEYASHRPGPTLAQEAGLLRVRLLLARGQRPAAAQLARRIIAQHPESTHVDSLRRLAAEP